MIDRNVQYPQRYQLVKVPGTDDIYDLVPAPGTVYNEGTLINKANLLTDAVTNLIGLTGDVMPNDMFNVLATVGDLHVWRRTVRSLDGKPETPAGYKLGSLQQNVGIYSYSEPVSKPSLQVSYADSVSVSKDGIVSLESPNTFRISDIKIHRTATSLLNQNCIGKFVLIDTSRIDANISVYQREIFFIPEGSEFSYNGTLVLSATKFQSVNGYPYKPGVQPSTVTVDYPVSVNPNAYQPGSDAKPAGYTLGAVQSGRFVLSNRGDSGWQMSWNYSDDVSVTGGGVVSLSNPASTGITGNMSSQAAQAAAELIKGKFVSCPGGQSDFQANTVYFIPSDAVVTSTGSQVWINKYQTVTGYPAIPAGTSIEYLGKLGDKARMQIVSYVGTGTYGSGNKTNISFSSSPSVVFVFRTGSNPTTSPYSNGWRSMAIFCKGMGLIQIDGSVSEFSVSGSVLTITSKASAASQLNQNGIGYSAMALFM